MPRQAIECRLLACLTAAANLGHLRQTHAQLLLNGLYQSNLLVTKLLRRLTDHKVPVYPYQHHIFLLVDRPNSFLFTALIRGYSVLGPHSFAFSYYSLMRQSSTTPPLSFTFSALFKACKTAGCVREGGQMHAQKISVGGYDSDLYVNNTLIDMYVGCGDLICARKVFDEMDTRDVISWTSMVVAYGRVGEMGMAGQMFEDAPLKDTVSWTAMITRYAQNARPGDAFRLFDRMVGEGVAIDEFTLAGVLSACAQLGAVTRARKIEDYAKARGHVRSLVVGSAMVDMFGKCGLLDDARRVFDGMAEKNVYTYSAMIACLAAHGRAGDAIKLFEKMVGEAKVKPNGVTFVGLLTACSHAGMLKEGKIYFAKMCEEYGIFPSQNHYACMVDLLGRSGLVQEAYELVKSMPMEPHGGVWGALLGACRIYGNVRVAEMAAEHLFKLEPNGIGNYVILSNVYASAAMWDKVLKVRRKIRGKELRKDPACSVIEGKDGVVHEFFADDGSHPKTREIKEAVEELTKRLKLAGYIPDLNSVAYDISDAEKEKILKGHSEKLALAFALLTTSTGDTIRIVKNLRVCVDCHIVMCLASSVTGREIVLRDNMRFHHFHDGQCSCGGFW